MKMVLGSFKHELSLNLIRGLNDPRFIQSEILHVQNFLTKIVAKMTYSTGWIHPLESLVG
jgi:hypothetical protein